MKTPPLLMAAALLFWGWQTGFLIFAGGMALILEASQFIKTRWEFSEKEYHRIWDLCALLFFGAVLIATTAEDIRLPTFALTQWLPFVFFPMIAAQIFGNSEKLKLRTFSWFLRRGKNEWAEKEINISYIYFAIVLLGAATVPVRGGRDFTSPLGEREFYFVAAALLAWAFASIRPRRLGRTGWIALVSIVAVGGFFTAHGLHELQNKVEGAIGSWLGRFARRNVDNRESRTSIGEIGRLKLSGKIVLRVEPESGTPPGLLRQTSYDDYRHESWIATEKDFSGATPETNDVWRLLLKDANRGVRISGYLEKGGGILALPHGTAEIHDLPVTMDTNSFGVVKVSEGPSFVNFLAKFSDGQAIDVSTNELDLKIPERESLVTEEVADALGLTSPEKTEDQKLQTIQEFFQKNFTYSTYISRRHVDRTKKKTPLAVFLTQARSGHCEYFATAAVLLARKAGIPARYAIGFAVQESSGNRFIVRERHAHAWALIFRNGVWEDFDATPPSWGEVESEHASLWEPISDFFSRLWFEFSKWRYSKTNYRQYAIWLLVPLVAFLVWRILFNKQRKRARLEDSEQADGHWPGLDSDFYRIEEKLEALGYHRNPSETISDWRQRIGNSPVIPSENMDLILTLHDRYRFDPNGITTSERSELSANVDLWLDELDKRKKAADTLSASPTESKRA